MDPQFLQRMDKVHPHLNPETAMGIASTQLEGLEAYIDNAWQIIAASFPEGLKYNGFERCLPEEELAQLTSRKTFDLSDSYVYMIKQFFEYHGEPITRYQQLLYVEQGGVTYLNGSRFVISPVLADKIISVTPKDIYVQLNCTKITFRRLDGYFMMDVGTDKEQRESKSVVWAPIYHLSSKHKGNTNVVRANTCMVHYLLCKYGLTDMFTKFCGTTPALGDTRSITPEAYPPEDWVIVSSIYGENLITQANKPKRRVAKDTVTSLRLAFKRDEFTQQVRRFVAGLYYVVDHFPQRFTDPTWCNEPNLWRTLMGEILFGSDTGRGRLIQEMDEHISTIDDYIDAIMASQFMTIGYQIKDIYELFVLVIDNFTDWLQTHGDNTHSIYNKSLSVLYYVTTGIVHQINLFGFRLRRATSKTGTNKKPLTKDGIEQLMRNTLKPGEIFKIKRGHGEVSTVSAVGDNMAFRLTTLLVPQAASSKNSRHNDKTLISDPSECLHVSVAEIGGYTNIPKGAPGGRTRLNHYAATAPDGSIIRSKALQPFLDELQQIIDK